MKKIFLTLFLLIISACTSGTGTESGGNNITEVGNPTSPTTPTTNKSVVSATLQTINGASVGLFSGLDLDNVGRLLGDDSDTGFECTYTRDSHALDCTCPVSGSLQIVFDSAFDASLGVVTFEHVSELVLSACEVSACDESVILDGTIDHSLSGTFNVISRSGEVTVGSTTIEECSGATYNTSSDYGFDILQTLDDDGHDFSGEFCFGTEVTTFSSIAELKTALDPNDECSDFEP